MSRKMFAGTLLVLATGVGAQASVSLMDPSTHNGSFESPVTSDYITLGGGTSPDNWTYAGSLAYLDSSVYGTPTQGNQYIELDDGVVSTDYFTSEAIGTVQANTDYALSGDLLGRQGFFELWAGSSLLVSITTPFNVGIWTSYSATSSLTDPDGAGPLVGVNDVIGQTLTVRTGRLVAGQTLLDNIRVEMTELPEPASLGLLATGGLLLLRRRK